MFKNRNKNFINKKKIHYLIFKKEKFKLRIDFTIIWFKNFGKKIRWNSSPDRNGILFYLLRAKNLI